jgi:hypothetical protein
MSEPSDDQFKQMVCYFFEEKGNPTRYTSWDADRCKRLMPAFFEAWTQSCTYDKLARLAVRAEAPEAE